MKKPGLPIKNVLHFIKKIPAAIARHAFTVSIFLIVIASGVGGFVFYKYSNLAVGNSSDVKEKPIQFNESDYNTVIKEWELRQEKLEEASGRSYPDPFR